MSFVFGSVVIPAIPPSPRAKELGRRLADTVRDFRQAHPEVSGLEIRQAMRLAETEVGAGVDVKLTMVLGFLAALAAAAGALWYMIMRR